MPGYVLIDGYNLLHVTGIVAGGIGPGTLQRARLALLGFLAASIEPERLARTTIVFDAAGRLPGLPQELEHGGLKVLFAADYADADTLIEELIRNHSAPRHLTVVSSDHRVQQAARRRKSQAVDSDVWYAQLLAGRKAARDDIPEQNAKSPVPLLAEDVDYWLRQFGGERAMEEWLEAELRRDSPSASAERRITKELPVDGSPDKPSGTEAGPLANPFPEGYGEDLLEEEP